MTNQIVTSPTGRCAADVTYSLYLRQNGCPLSETEINTKIVDRSYQHEAIRRVEEEFAKGKRKALVVMATGTGKTRTVMGLIDVFTALPSRGFMMAWKDNTIGEQKQVAFNSKLRFNLIPK